MLQRHAHSTALLRQLTSATSILLESSRALRCTCHHCIHTTCTCHTSCTSCPAAQRPQAATFASWLRYSHDQPQDSGSDASDSDLHSLELSSHLIIDAQRLVRDPATMLMAARGVPLGIVMRMKQADGSPPRFGFGATSAMGSMNPAQRWEQALWEASAAAAEEEEAAEQEARANARESGRAVAAEEEAGVSGSAVGEAEGGMEGVTSGNQKLKELIASLRLATAAKMEVQGGGGGAPAAGGAGFSAAGQAAGNRGSDGESSDDDEDDKKEAEEVTVSSQLQQQQLQSINELKSELRNMDEVFEALAEVPWLDESEPEHVEKKTLLRDSLVATLEEGGWRLKGGLDRIWSGERDTEQVVGGASPRERLALVSVLFHTMQLEAQYGPPPPPAQRQAGAQVE